MELKRDIIQYIFAQMLEKDRVTIYKAGSNRYSHVLSPALFNRLVEENSANLTKGPTADNRVAYSEPALARLKLICDSNKLHRSFVPSDLPDLADLYWAFEKARLYIPFQKLCDDLVALTDRAAQEIFRLGLETTLVMLALPGSTVEKSSIWFDAHVWKESFLVEIVDFIIPGEEALQRIIDALPVGPPFDRIVVLYVDDMAYSGSQFYDFSHLLARVDTKGLSLEVWPLVAYMSDSVPLNMLRYSGGSGVGVPTPRMSTAVRTLRYWLRDFDYTKKATGEEIKALRDHFGSSDPKDIFLRDLWITFMEALDMPVVVFEHKLADYASISINLFDQKDYADPDDDPAMGPLQRQLVTIGKGKLVNMRGSEAFYKSQKWTYKKEVLPDTAKLVTLYSYALRAPVACFNCAAPAEHICSQCQVATYCGVECQTQHVAKGFHAIMCQKK